MMETCGSKKELTQRDEKMHTIGIQLVYLLQGGEVEVVIATVIFLEGIVISRQETHALIMGIYDVLELWKFCDSTRRREVAPDAYPGRWASAVGEDRVEQDARRLVVRTRTNTRKLYEKTLAEPSE